MKITAKPGAMKLELKPGPCSIHVTNLGPREAVFLGSLVALFTDPQLTKLGCDLIDGKALVAVDQVTGKALVIDADDIFRPVPQRGRN